ncbi:hypothetical protein [Mesorhizobium sp. WSM3860]|uniref:hypothetical protein n=1 Tax=Mesorhizobium sp. WSM3860 TaxID=2029403 RepID=UPI0011410988|nr:hypothetical protein [Mesorhizobium sp. WSM3860]
MNEAREVRLRLVELVGTSTSGEIDPDKFFQTVLVLERFVWVAGVAKSEEPADSAAPITDNAGTA